MFCDETFARYFIVEFTEEARKCVNSYALIEEVKRVPGTPPKRAFGNHRRLVTVEVSRKEQSKKMASIKKVDGFPCEVKIHSRFNYFNYIEATIYVHEIDLENIYESKQGLKESYNITDIIPALFINAKFPQTHVFWILF